MKDVKIKIEVVTKDPETDELKIRVLNCEFYKMPDTYGNKTYLDITGDNDFSVLYDLRYDTNFRTGKEYEYIKNWCHWYWSGKDGAHEVIYVKKLALDK